MKGLRLIIHQESNELDFQNHVNAIMANLDVHEVKFQRNLYYKGVTTYTKRLFLKKKETAAPLTSDYIAFIVYWQPVDTPPNALPSNG
jgi:hypothetical protein